MPPNLMPQNFPGNPRFGPLFQAYDPPGFGFDTNFQAFQQGPPGINQNFEPGLRPHGMNPNFEPIGNFERAPGPGMHFERQGMRPNFENLGSPGHGLNFEIPLAQRPRSRFDEPPRLGPFERAPVTGMGFEGVPGPIMPGMGFERAPPGPGMSFERAPGPGSFGNQQIQQNTFENVQQIEQKIDEAKAQEQIRLQQAQLRQQQEEQRRQQQQKPVTRPLQPLIPGLIGTGLAPGPQMPPMGAQGQGGFQGLPGSGVRSSGKGLLASEPPASQGQGHGVGSTPELSRAPPGLAHNPKVRYNNLV
jgi:hypothetical protein